MAEILSRVGNAAGDMSYFRARMPSAKLSAFAAVVRQQLLVNPACLSSR
jgi:hypothetical protein